MLVLNCEAYYTKNTDNRGTELYLEINNPLVLWSSEFTYVSLPQKLHMQKYQKISIVDTDCKTICSTDIRTKDMLKRLTLKEIIFGVKIFLIYRFNDQFYILKNDDYTGTFLHALSCRYQEALEYRINNLNDDICEQLEKLKNANADLAKNTATLVNDVDIALQKEIENRTAADAKLELEILRLKDDGK